MKKIILTLGFALLGFAAMAQVTKPTLMVVPSPMWCNQKGYTIEFDNMGVAEKMPDYDRALLEDRDLNMAIAKINEMMAERGFPLKDLAATLRTLKTQAAQNAVRTSSDGMGIAESPLDKMKSTANADIWIELDFALSDPNSFKKSMIVTLRGLDAYTDVQIAGNSGQGAPSTSAAVPILVQEAVISYIDGFNNQLQAYFEDMAVNGRMVTLELRAWDGGDVDFETEFDGEELGFAIEYWMDDNTVNGRYNPSLVDRNRIVFEQVRIPLKNERGAQMNTRRWADGLRSYMSKTYGITAKLETLGLGKAIIIVGGK